jgi:hypothetical protein
LVAHVIGLEEGFALKIFGNFRDILMEALEKEIDKANKRQATLASATLSAIDDALRAVEQGIVLIESGSNASPIASMASPTFRRQYQRRSCINKPKG